MTIPPEILGRELEVEYAFYPYRAGTRHDPPEEEIIDIIAVWEGDKKVALHIKEERRLIDYIGKEIHKKE